jgi:ligand-binding sensor domain-containing protein
VGVLFVNGSDLFVGTGDKGIFISTDSGARWRPVNSGLSNLAIPALEGKDSDLYAGTANNGVFMSSDMGKSWLPTALTHFTNTATLAVNGTTLIAGSANYGFGNGGISISTDSGKTWVITDSNIADNVLVKSGTDLLGGTDTGVFLSSDGGMNWNLIGLEDSNVIALAQTGSYIYASTGDLGYRYGYLVGCPNGNVFYSGDFGVTWSADSSLTNRKVWCFATNGSSLFAGTDSGLYLSSNNGLSWLAPTNGLTNDTVFTILVTDTYLFAGTAQNGIFISIDSGKNWRQVNEGLQDLNILSLTTLDDNVFVGTDSSGVWRRPLSEMINTSAVETQAPLQTSLTAYPNPLSQSTTIRFTSVESGVARVTVVNLLGEEVTRVFEGALTSGEHSFLWSKPTGLPSGMYECVVEMNGSIQQVPVVITH